MHEHNYSQCTYKLPTNIDDISPVLANPKARQWSAPTGRIWVQVDNQQLANALEGKSFLDAGPLRPVFIRIARGLLSFLRAGFRPRLETTFFVEWEPREFNAVADHAANVTLDEGKNWTVENTDAMQLVWRLPHNLRLNTERCEAADKQQRE